jgi:hypothetical protein
MARDLNQEKKRWPLRLRQPQQLKRRAGGKHEFVQGVHGVRCQVQDVARSVVFYTTHLGFTQVFSSKPVVLPPSVRLADVEIRAIW